MVFSGFTAACRRAKLPTRRSPDLVNATTEGVVREPSLLAITVGWPPSMTATQELVVPRSIPIILPIVLTRTSLGNLSTGRVIYSRASTESPGHRPDLAHLNYEI